MTDTGTPRSWETLAAPTLLSSGTSAPCIPVYEQQLSRDPRWALSEGSRHFEEQSAVFQTLYKITSRLRELGIPYAVVGGMALFRHGLRRFTEDVDLLVNKHDLKVIHDRLGGLGYLPPFASSKNLRDTEFGVKIEFLTAGDFPGDGKPKPVVFPEPTSVSFESDGIRYVNLPTLIELKLASGMTNPGRLKDLADVLELIKVLNLADRFADNLNPFVQGKFRELWRQARKRFVTTWHGAAVSAETRSHDDVVKAFRAASEQLAQMLDDGVFVDSDAPVRGDRVRLVTFDPQVAAKYGMVEESEAWDLDDDDASGVRSSGPEHR